jgi:hypothetical protein
MKMSAVGNRKGNYTGNQKKEVPKTLCFQDYTAERQGFEPWQRLHVDRLAICSITTLAPLQIFKVRSLKYRIKRN